MDSLSKKIAQELEMNGIYASEFDGDIIVKTDEGETYITNLGDDFEGDIVFDLNNNRRLWYTQNDTPETFAQELITLLNVA